MGALSGAHCHVLVKNKRPQRFHCVDLLQIGVALDAGAADFQPEEGCFTVYTDPDAINDVAKALEDKGYKFDSAQIEMVPQTYQKLEKQEDRDNMEKMLDLFEEDDDVQNVWHNWDQE